MMKTDYATHARECAFYGVKPLSRREVTRMHREGLEGANAAYSLACDLSNGWSWSQSVDALKRAAH